MNHLKNDQCSVFFSTRNDSFQLCVAATTVFLFKKMKTRVYIFALTLIVSAIIIYCFWTRLFFNDFYDDYPTSDNYDPNNRSEAVSLRLVTAFSGNHFREAL